jgi:uncharacterized membrane protein YdfJ with MMPL/SSD domain
MAITHDLREFTVRLTEIAAVADAALALLNLLPLLEALLDLLDAFVALLPLLHLLHPRYALRAHRIAVCLPLLEALAAIKLRTACELLSFGLHPRLRNERGPLRALGTRLLARFLALLALLLAILLDLLIVVGVVARAGDRRARRSTRQ